MKTTLAFLLLLAAVAARADTPVEDIHADAKTGKIERRTIMVHDRPLTVSEGMALDAKRKAADDAKASAKVQARRHVDDCAAGKLIGDACSGTALAKDIAALLEEQQ